MALQILTALWGQKHVDLFEKAALKSLTWERNLTFLREIKAKWNIFADDEHHTRIQKMLPSHIHFQIKSTTSLRDYIDQVQSATIWQMKECLSQKDKLLLAPPDTIFGDGTLHNLWELGSEPNACVVVPHPRVLPEIIHDLEFESTLSNPKLVSLAWKRLHKAWSDAEEGHPINNSYVGGVKWKKLQKNLYAVTHRLPTVYLAEFTDEDLQYFKSAISFGHFDHRWAGDILVPRGRQRYCGSSDACFVIEITEPDKNVPPIVSGQPKEGFWQNWPHNHHNSQIQCIFRGE